MKRMRIVEVIFLIAFILCGCGIESIFTGGKELATWLVTAFVTLAAASVLGTRK